MGKGGVAKGLLAAVLCGTLMWTSCSTVWVSEAEQIVAALIPGLANLVTVVATLEGRNVSAADLQTVQSAGAQAAAGLELIQGLITQYERADAAAQAGLLSQIQAAVSTVQATLNGLLAALHIKDATTQAKITAVIGILLSEVESVAAIVPLVTGAAAPAMMTGEKRLVTGHAPLTAREFVGSYNAAMTAKTGNANLDQATTRMTIHLHGKLARWASAGLLK